MVRHRQFEWQREMEQRLRAAFATSSQDPHAPTLPGALAALGHLCRLHYPTEKIGQVLIKLPRPNPTQRKILQTFQVNLPRMQAAECKTPFQLHLVSAQSLTIWYALFV